jgi:hypothetical protein
VVGSDALDLPSIVEMSKGPAELLGRPGEAELDVRESSQ